MSDMGVLQFILAGLHLLTYPALAMGIVVLIVVVAAQLPAIFDRNARPRAK